ncbi:hypothetical protein [Pedosphaera parvula]|uniref:Uncharacterized protein n=1 Tax=Pedosphaera parvula (strain Ellin514) TaxID=320771 RepID=B9XKK5_PEDPL|nr:hypothetical protein [Pedosphaera parvula]EEF59675.1 hypothetical protein Cflav_PD2664 [Pedosphaera parvula Ellin514]
MKVLILDEDSRLFLGYNEWTDMPREAKDLGFTAHAHAVATQLGLKTFQILFYFPDIDSKVVVSNNGSQSNQQSKV